MLHAEQMPPTFVARETHYLVHASLNTSRLQAKHGMVEMQRWYLHRTACIQKLGDVVWLAYQVCSVALTSGLSLYRVVRSTLTSPRKSGALLTPSKSNMFRCSVWSNGFSDLAIRNTNLQGECSSLVSLVTYIALMQPVQAQMSSKTANCRNRKVKKVTFVIISSRPRH